MHRLALAAAGLLALWGCDDGTPDPEPDAGFELDCESALRDRIWKAEVSAGVASAASAEKIDPQFAALRAAKGLPGLAFAMSVDGDLVFARGYGFADVAARVPMNADTVMRVASVSKHVTALAVQRLVEDAALGLDEKMVDVLPDLRTLDGGTPGPDVQEVTVRHLLNHSSGIPDWDFTTGPPPDPPTRTKVLSTAVSAPLASPPGTMFCYSNVGFYLLTEIVERRAGAKYEEFVKGQLLGPSGTVRFELPDPTVSKVDDEAYYVTQTAAAFWNDDFRPHFADGYGGWVASTVDLLRLQRHADRRASFPDLVTLGSLDGMVGDVGLASCHTGPSAYSGYGRGTMVFEEANAWGHLGRYPGLLAAYLHLEPGLGFAALIPTDPLQVDTTPPAIALIQLFESLRDQHLAGTLGLLTGDHADQFVAFSAWMNAAEYEDLRLSEQAQGRFPRRIDGRAGASGAEFRAQFVPAPAVFSSRIGMTCEELQAELDTASPRVLTGLDRYEEGGAARYAASWASY